MPEQQGVKRLRRLYETVAQRKKNGRIEDVERLLCALGFELKPAKRGKGSHQVFRKAGRRPISIPAHRPLNERYVDEVLTIAVTELEWIFGTDWRSEKNDRS